MANERLQKILNDTNVNINTKVSISMHPDTIQPMGDALVDGGDGPAEGAYRSARNLLRHYYQAGSELDAAHAALLKPTPSGKRGPDGKPHITMAIPEERTAELASAMVSRAARLGKVCEQHYDNIDASLGEIERRVAASITNSCKNDVSEATTASEIRGYVAGLKKAGERMDFLHKSIERGDHKVVSAVLDGSCWVAGLDPDEFGIIKEMAEQKFSPRYAKQADALRRVKKQCEQATEAFGELLTSKLPRVKEDRKESALQQLKTGGAA